VLFRICSDARKQQQRMSWVTLWSVQYAKNCTMIREYCRVDTGHSICFACIESWRGDRQPGESLSCPCCRHRFTLPRELPKNYSLMDIIRTTRESGSAEPGSAVYCDLHADKEIEIHCVDCKIAICVMCAIKFHNGHKVSDSDDLRIQMASDVVKVISGMNILRKMARCLEKEKKDFIEQLETTKLEIDKQAERLKQIMDVQSRREKLMNELASMKRKRVNEIESLREEIERQLLFMESYKKYVDEVRQKRTACDIARAASGGLHERAHKLLKLDVFERKLADLGHADITFTSSNYVTALVSRTLGQLHMNIGNTGKSTYCYLRQRGFSFVCL